MSSPTSSPQRRAIRATHLGSRNFGVSRNAAGWGLPVPGDPSQVIYVWCDALASYITQDLEYWRDAERIHVIGKGITRFHAVYWLAFLLAADLPLPHRIAVHGYLTIDGKKISKSAGGADVEPFIATCGVDAVRWYFARRCRTRADSDVTVRAICDTYDRDLADRLGVQRCTAAKLTGGRVPPREGSPLQALAEALPTRVDAALREFLVDDAASAICDLIDAANREVERSAPWKHPERSVYAPLEAARIAAAELLPFVRNAAQIILARLGSPSAGPTWGLLEPGAHVIVGPPPLPRKQFKSQYDAV